MPFVEVGILEGSGLEHPSGAGSGPAEVPTSDQETEEPRTRRILRHPVPPQHHPLLLHPGPLLPLVHTASHSSVGRTTAPSQEASSYP